VNRFFVYSRFACLGLVGLLGAVAPAAAQQVSEARLQELMEQARLLAGIQASAPTQATSVAATRPVVNLTMDDTVKLTIDNNIDISVQRLNPQIQDYALAQVRAAYRPTLTGTLGDRSARSAGTSQISGGAVVDTGTYTWNAGVSQAIPWTGATANVNFNNSRQNSTSNNATVNPNYSANLQFSATQPLLRNRSIDANRQSIKTTQIARDLADVTLKATLTNTVAAARNAYWDLVYAIQAVEAARQSLALAQRLVQDNQTRVEIGTLAPIDVVSAQSEVANRQQTLVSAESTRRTAELTLKRYLVSSTQDPLWESTINPVDQPPTATMQPIDLAGAIRTALEGRTDVVQARENLRSSEISLRYLKNQTLPGLDLTATYTTQGTGGPRLIRDASLGGQIIATIPGGYNQAINTLRKVLFPSWNVSMSISYPIGTSSQDANYARSKVQMQQSQAQLRALELTVATDLTNAALQVQNYFQQVQAAAASRELAQKKLEAEQSKFEVGMSTNYTVVQYQRDLRDAQNSELRAILNYRKAVVDFERLQIAK
jgi:outer membrane protein